ncbi:unnamed protein product [Meloidogyne enterolobii]|uniref:Uncharacterized protein n=1 Tax=Meloidogyne enterolobii TaxID=390850 RepID=A0ACB0Z3H8_MELEN
MPKMWDLLRKSKYYLINVHPLGQFPFPNIPKRIVNIGGIEVEIEGILNEIKEEKKLKEKMENKGLTGFLKNKVKEFVFEDPVFEWIKKTDCFVLFYITKGHSFKGFTDEYFNKLVETFVKYDKCKFVVQLRIGFEFPMLKKDPLFPWRIDPNVYKNIYFYFVKEVNLQKLLGKISLKNFACVYFCAYLTSPKFINSFFEVTRHT